MKSDRRHELQTNYLANQLGTVVESGKPYAVWVIGGVIGVALAALVFGLYSSWQQRAETQAWGEYYFSLRADDPEVFQAVVDQYPRSQAAAWAAQNLADSQLKLGLDRLYVNRELGEEHLNSAVTTYQNVLKSTNDFELRDRATIGLAQAYEGLGKLDEAARHYQQVASSNALPALSSSAAARAAWLKTPEAQEFYTWFASERRVPDAPPQLNPNLGIVPTMPDFTFPANPALPPSGTTPPPPADGIGLPDAPADPAPADPALSEPAPVDPAPADRAPDAGEPAGTEPAASADGDADLTSPTAPQ
jgi:hypothetical protein